MTSTDMQRHRFLVPKIKALDELFPGFEKQKPPLSYRTASFNHHFGEELADEGSHCNNISYTALIRKGSYILRAKMTSFLFSF